MNEKIEKVHRFLEANGIEYKTHYHPPLPTIELALEYWKDIDSTHCKNLFFRNHKGNRHYLVIFECHKELDIHSLESYTDMDINDFEEYNLATRRGLIPEIAPRYRYTYFAHIFNGGYSSGYYFYLWAEVLDKDAFAAFAESRDICDKELAHSFRYDLLAQGGQRAGMDMYRKFRGADPDKTAMLKARGLWTEPVVEEQVDEVVETAEAPVEVKKAPLTQIPGRPVKTAPKLPTK